jgi:hypothetical protein
MFYHHMTYIFLVYHNYFYIFTNFLDMTNGQTCITKTEECFISRDGGGMNNHRY